MPRRTQQRPPDRASTARRSPTAGSTRPGDRRLGRRRFVATLALGASAGLAGCSFLEDEPADPRDEDLPRGVTGDGVEEVTTLVDRHEVALSSFRRRQVLEYVVAEEGSVTGSGLQVLTAASDPAALRLEYVERGALPGTVRPPYTGLWTTEEASVIRTGQGDDAEVRTQDRPQDRPPMDAGDRVGRALGGARLLGVEETDEGPLTWLRSTGDPHRAVGLEDATAFEAVASVRRHGPVTYLREHAEARVGRRDVSMTTTNRFTDVGETTVRRPDWADG